MTLDYSMYCIFKANYAFREFSTIGKTRMTRAPLVRNNFENKVYY